MKKTFFILLMLSPFISKAQHNYNQVPLYSPDFELLEKALNQKQSLYNERVKEINMRVSTLNQLISQVAAKHGKLSQVQSESVTRINQNLANIWTWDLSITANYYNAVNWLDNCQKVVISWL